MFSHIPKKYQVVSPLTNPEAYSPNNHHISKNKVRSLFIPYDLNYEPLVITDYFDVIYDTLFHDIDSSVIHSFNNYHMYYDQIIQWSSFSPNFVATSILRNDFLSFNGDILTDCISGNVLIFGSLNPLTKVIDNNSYSVPYEIIEQTVRLYEIYKNKQVKSN